MRDSLHPRERREVQHRPEACLPHRPVGRRAPGSRWPPPWETGRTPRTGGWEKASNELRAVISVAGNYDPASAGCWGRLWKPNGLESLEGRKLRAPINHVSKAMTPILLFHSDNDKSVPISIGLGWWRP